MTNLEQLDIKIEALIDAVGACEYTSSFKEDRALHNKIARLKKSILSYVDGGPVLPEERIARCFTLLAASLDRAAFRDVLAAWRGPDNAMSVSYAELDAIKNRTTAVIRRAVLEQVPLTETDIVTGGTEGYYYYDGLMVASKAGTSVRLTEDENYTHSHFFVHVKAAARSLGIKIEVTENTDVSI